MQGHVTIIHPCHTLGDPFKQHFQLFDVSQLRLMLLFLLDTAPAASNV